jgi:glyoxylase-like metal-dependent hydrolase (beta-lactamase superfamily II)/rhodanese-related sulfurtransferase
LKGVKQQIGGLPEGVVLFRYSPLGAGRSSYLLVDVQSKTAAAMDPLGEADSYLEDAWSLGAKIKHVFLTSVRDELEPDALELRDRACATVYAGAWARRNGPYMLLKDGDTFEFGRVRLRVLETPGHRLESIVLVLSDLRTEAQSALAAFTGETVLIGDIGRPDVQPSDGFGPGDLAGMLYVSLGAKILSLPDSARIFPALESDVDLPAERPDTIGAQRKHNPGFQKMSREEFVRRVSEGMTEERSTRCTRGSRPDAMTLEEVLRAQEQGAQVVDDRDPIDYASGHLAGSLNVPDSASFEEWVAGVVDPACPIVLVTETGREKAYASRLLRAGMARASGYLDVGHRVLRESPVSTRRSLRRSISLLKGPPGDKRLVLDTRPFRDQRLGPVVQAINLPLGLLRGKVEDLPREVEILVCDDFPCRSSAAASFLRSRGFPNVSEIGGGLALWGAPPRD